MVEVAPFIVELSYQVNLLFSNHLLYLFLSGNGTFDAVSFLIIYQLTEIVALTESANCPFLMFSYSSSEIVGYTCI